MFSITSSQKQKSELANQKAAMEQFCLARGYAVDEWITEIGDGLNLTKLDVRNFVEVFSRWATINMRCVVW